MVAATKRGVGVERHQRRGQVGNALAPLPLRQRVERGRHGSGGVSLVDADAAARRDQRGQDAAAALEQERAQERLQLLEDGGHLCVESGVLGYVCKGGRRRLVWLFPRFHTSGSLTQSPRQKNPQRPFNPTPPTDR